MNGKVTFVLLLALARAIHINDDTANAAGSQPDFNFPSGNDQGAQPGFNLDTSGQGQGNWPGNQGGQAVQPGQGANQGGQGGFGPRQGGADSSNYMINVDLQSIPGPDITIFNGLWAFYQDLVAPSASLNLIYAAKLGRSDGSVSWRLVYQLVGPNWGVTYFAVQVVSKNGQWTYDHGFFTHALNEVIFLWGLPASTSFGNLNVQGLLAALLANNPFAQINQGAIQQAVDAARAELQVTIQTLTTDKTTLQQQIVTLQAQIAALQQQGAGQQQGNQDNNGRGWYRDRSQNDQGQWNQNQSAPQAPTQVNTNGAIVDKRGNVQFPNAILNIGSSRGNKQDYQ